MSSKATLIIEPAPKKCCGVCPLSISTHDGEVIMCAATKKRVLVSKLNNGRASWCPLVITEDGDE